MLVSHFRLWASVSSRGRERRIKILSRGVGRVTDTEAPPGVKNQGPDNSDKKVDQRFRWDTKRYTDGLTIFVQTVRKQQWTLFENK